MTKTLLDAALGTAKAEDLSIEELTKGLVQNAMSDVLLQALWSKSSTSGQKQVVKILCDNNILRLRESFLKNLVGGAVFSKRMEVESAYWILKQRHLSVHIACEVLRKGIYKGRFVPLERFFQSCLLLRKHAPRWDFTAICPPQWVYTPIIAANIPDAIYSDEHAIGVIFREDAGEMLRNVGSRQFARAILRKASRKEDARRAQSNELVSRSVCPRCTIATVVFSHPHIDESMKLELIVHMTCNHLVSLDNLIQLGALPKDLLVGDLREGNRLANEYINEFRRVKGGAHEDT